MDWTVVRHKKGSARHKKGSASRSAAKHPARHVPSNKSCAASLVGISSTPAESLQPSDKSEEERLQFSDESEEERLLLGKVQRAIAKVEHSVFFTRFMNQVQDLGVVANLNRSSKRASANQEGGAADALSEEDADQNFGADDGKNGLSQGTSTVELVVYGVGSISNSEISRCQLSLAVLLKRKSALIGNILVYDPIMSPSECSVMLQLGCCPLENNDQGRRPLNGPTLFYMPHCDVELYESVLQANLKAGSVSQLVVLGNSFRTYQERWSVSPLPHGERPSCLLKVQTSVEEIPVADSFSPSAFNDTSWHFFSKVEVSKLS